MDGHERANSPSTSPFAFQRAPNSFRTPRHRSRRSLLAQVTASYSSRPLLDPNTPASGVRVGQISRTGREVCQSPQAQSREPNRYLGSRAVRTLLGCLLGCGPFQGGNRASQLHRCQRRVAVMPESLPAPHLASCIGRAPSVFGASASQCSMFRSASVRFPYAAVTFLLVGFRGAGALSSSLDVIDEHPPLPARRSRAQLLKAPAFRSLCSPFGHACSQFLVQFGNNLPWTPGNNGGRGLDTSLDSS